MTDSVGVLNRELHDALARVRVDARGLSATIGGHQIAGRSRRELEHKLATALYECLHVGRSRPLVHHARNRRDPEYEEQLRAAVPHRHTPMSGTIVGVCTRSGTVVCELEGVRVQIRAGDIDALVPGQVVTVQSDCARPRLSPGFLLVVGSAGPGMTGGPILRVYVHVDRSEAGPRLWAAMLAHLEALQVPYTAKVASIRADLPRRDGMVVYLARAAWHVAETVDRALSRVPGRGSRHSPYTSPLAPGVSAAWEPEDRRPGASPLSFGQHRSAAIANGLVKHASDAAAPLDATVAAALVEANINPRKPFANLTPSPLTDRSLLEESLTWRNQPSPELRSDMMDR